MRNPILYHALAIVTVAIWGITFISTKMLIQHGLSPEEIFFYRFLMAYVCMVAIAHKRLFASTGIDEFKFFLCGISGGSLYFVVENTALGITLASNVGLIISTAPLFTMLFSRLFIHNTRLPSKMVAGALIALTGVGAVVFNGNMVLKINPLGDMLTLVAAALWAVYSLLLKDVSNRYSTFFITRKVFFYGIATVAVYFLFRPIDFRPEVMALPVVYGNLLFLGLGASLMCYISWNVVVRHLGAAKASNYLYFIPLVTLVAATVLLSEPLSVISVCGAALILGGVILAEK